MRIQAHYLSDLAWKLYAFALTLPPCQINWTRKRIITTALVSVFLLYFGLYIYYNTVHVPDRLLFLPKHVSKWYTSCANRNPKERLLAGLSDGRTAEKLAKTILIYNYYDHEGSTENLKFFLAHGLHDRPDTHFLFVLSSKPCASIPERRNIGVIESPHGCLGFGAVKAIVHRFGIDKAYDYVLVTGSWVKGPFMPMWSHACWTDTFTHMLDDKHPMVGTGYRCFAPDGSMKPHLHPTLWAFKPIALLPVLAEFHCPSADDVGSLTAQISHYRVLRQMNLSIATMGTSLHSEPLEQCPKRWLYQPHPYEGIFINPRLPWHLKYPYEVDIHSEVDTDNWKHSKYANEAMSFSHYDSRKFCKS